MRTDRMIKFGEFANSIVWLQVRGNNLAETEAVARQDKRALTQIINAYGPSNERIAKLNQALSAVCASCGGPRDSESCKGCEVYDVLED